VVGAAALLLAAAPAAGAAEPDHPVDHVGVPGPLWLDLLVRIVLITGTSLVAGAGLLRSSGGQPNRLGSTVVWVAATMAALALGLGLDLSGWAMFVVLPQIGLTLLIAAVLRDSPHIATPAAGVLALIVTAEVNAGLSGAELVLSIVGTVAGFLALGGLLLLVTGRPERPRRLAAVVVVAAAVVAATVGARALLAGVRPGQGMLDTDFGRFAILTTVLVLVALAACLPLVAGRSAVLGGRTALLLPLILAVGLGSGASLAALDHPPSPATPGGPALVRAVLGGSPATIVVAPHRPGPNLVWVSDPAVQVGLDPDALLTAVENPGLDGGWVTVELPAGTSRLWIDRDGTRVPILLDARSEAPEMAGLTGPSGAECLSAAVGALAGGGVAPSRCPANELPAADAVGLVGAVRTLASRGAPDLRLVTDSTPRSAAAEAVVRKTAAETGMLITSARQPGGATLVLADADTAFTVLADHVNAPAPYGVYLAPWLAVGSLMHYSSGAVVPIAFDPQGEDPTRYIDALRRQGIVDALATPSGYRAWRSATGAPPLAEPVRLFAGFAGFYMFPNHKGHGSGDELSWIPGGRVTAVSPPLTP
jgi:hypothetical protein